MKKIRFRRFFLCLSLLLGLGFLFGCSGGGGGGTSSSNPAEGSNFDEMQWDLGKWG